MKQGLWKSNLDFFCVTNYTLFHLAHSYVLQFYKQNLLKICVTVYLFFTMAVCDLCY